MHVKALIIAVIVIVIVALAIFFGVYYGESAKLSMTGATYYSGVIETGESVVVVAWPSTTTTTKTLSKAFNKKVSLSTSAFGGTKLDGIVTAVNQTDGWMAFMTSATITPTATPITAPAAPASLVTIVNIVAQAGSPSMASAAASGDSLRAWFV